MSPLFIRNGWKPEEQLRVGYLFLYPSEVQIKSATYYCRYLMDHFPGIVPLRRNDHLIMIIRESLYFGRDCTENHLAELILFIRDCNFRIGLSNSCRDFKQLRYYVRQAEIALNHGLLHDETVWCHQFSDCAFVYLLQEACHSMPVELLCAQELIFLKKYDEAKKTEYLATLKAYLNHQMNASQTAKALFIHQATMVYRLKRLQELINIDFSNADQMLFLHLSYKLLEYNGLAEF
ncbi:helix-turn-helix domain-containing protein [Eubacteriaceae bacterium ES2]|nr:helix-turn-helix domain-containing protein [Eubacteriaceae bacterium ES2]